MWKLLWIFCLIFGEEDELEDFINVPIKIYFAGYGSTFLGLDTKTHNLVARNKYIDFEKHNFDPISKIVKDGDLFEIYYGGSRMCVSGSLIAKCETNGGWKLSRVNFGYTIGKDSKCITKDSVDTVKMKKCTETDDQIFMFKAVSDLGDCAVKDALDTKDKHKIDVNIVPFVGTEDNKIKIEGTRKIAHNHKERKKYKMFDTKRSTPPDDYEVEDFSYV